MTFRLKEEAMKEIQQGTHKTQRTKMKQIKTDNKELASQN